MTMLDRMRRHKAWLKWSLAIVVVAFVLLYVPSFLHSGGVGAAPDDVLATVNGQQIDVQTYRRAYQMQVDALRQSGGGEVSDEMLRQLGVSQRVIQQLIEDAAVTAEAIGSASP